MLRAVTAFLLLSSVSAFADDMASANSTSSLPMVTAMTSGTKPAVDGVNGQVQIFSGAGQGDSVSINGIAGMSPTRNTTVWKDIGVGTGTITVPVGHSFGAQADLGSGAFGNSVLGLAAGHLYWRDPEKGMVGIYGDGLLLQEKVPSGVWTAAVEFESYIGKFTGRAILGVQGANFYTAGLNTFEVISYGGPSHFMVSNYFTDIVEAKFYPLDDLAISVGHSYSFGRNAVIGEVEYMFPQLRG